MACSGEQWQLPTSFKCSRKDEQTDPDPLFISHACKSYRFRNRFLHESQTPHVALSRLKLKGGGGGGGGGGLYSEINSVERRKCHLKCL